jgi:hypothetical protein
MSIVSSQDILSYLGVSSQVFFVVNASCDGLYLKYDGGTNTLVDIPDGTYEGASLATAMQTAINTAFTSSSTISWSSTTRKFTFDAGSGHTFTYTHSGSDAGLLVGFNTDHSAARTLTSDIEAGDPTENIEVLHLAAEKMIQNYCNRNFESQSYKERYNGTGTSTLVLRQYPVTAITRLSLWPVDVIRVRNTNTSTNATLSCSTSAVTLNHDGVLSTIDFATYTTFGSVVTAINAVGDGWEASLQSSTYSSFKSTELIERMGLYCLESTWAYLQMPYQRGELDFDINSTYGIIKLFRYYEGGELAGFPIGQRNIFVDYTAGYSSSNMPVDLKLAVKIMTKYLVQRGDEEAFGTKNLNAGEISVGFEEGAFPKEVLLILNQYRTKTISVL